MKTYLFVLISMATMAFAKDSPRPFLSSAELGILKKPLRHQYIADLTKKGHKPEPELMTCFQKQPYPLCRLSYALYIHSSMQRCESSRCKAEGAIAKVYRKKIEKERQ